MELGSVTVSLGMPKADVLKRFADAGTKVTDLGDVVFAEVGSSTPDLRFKNGTVIYADLEWYRNDTNGVDAVLGALSALAESNGNRPCALVHAPISTPDLVTNKVLVSCGGVSVLIANGKITITGTPGTPSVTVSQRIGDFPSDQK